VKTLVDQKTNLEVYTVSNQKPMEVVTHGLVDTLPFPLLDNQTRSSVQHQLAAEGDECRDGCGLE